MKEQTANAIDAFARSALKVIRQILPENDSPTIQDLEQSVTDLTDALANENLTP
jgi:hypothetical protein